MKAQALITLLLLATALTGCIGGEGDQSDPVETNDALNDTTADWAAEIPDVIGTVEQFGQALFEGESITGAGIWTEGDYAYVSGLGTGFWVVDLTDPEFPEVVGNISGDRVFSRDADLLRTDGMLVVVLATQSGGMTFVDVTDPTTPEILSILDIDPNHNVAVVPDSTIVYNSPSTGEGRSNEIVDASDPRNATIVGEFGNYGCHDTTFYVDDDKQRAYCAGVDVTEIWDISDPLSPELLTTVSNPCMDDDAEQVPRSNCGGLHHTAFVNHDASVLIIGDEFQGGAGPGCGYHAVSPTDHSASTPIGALWFYDITDENAPSLQGWLAPSVPVNEHLANMASTAENNPTAAPFSASCTSHFGDLIPGHEMAVMGWYQAGVLLIDFSDPANPRIVDSWNQETGTWDAQVHNGYVFTGDMNRGLDVFRFLGE